MDLGAAQALLAPYGLNEHDAAEIYAELGGTVLGLLIASEQSKKMLAGGRVPLFSVPRMNVLDIERAWQRFELGHIGFFTENFPTGFTVKYSGYGEAFSLDAMRGGHAVNLWDGQDRQTAATVIEHALQNVPPQTRRLVFQEYMQPSDTSTAVVVHARESDQLAEVSYYGTRIFYERRQGVEGASRVTTPYARPLGNYRANVPTFLKIAELLRSRIGFDVELEFFGRQQGPVVTQLRPITRDVDGAVAKEHGRRIRQQLANPNNQWHITRWVFGVWSKAARVGEHSSGPAIFAKMDDRPIEDDPVIMERLVRGLPTLVLDCVDCLRLRNDRLIIPQDRALRRSFAYVSVANTPLASVRDGQLLSVISDGNIGIARLANK